jgi:hypothetical protein
VVVPDIVMNSQKIDFYYNNILNEVPDAACKAAISRRVNRRTDLS